MPGRRRADTRGRGEAARNAETPGPRSGPGPWSPARPIEPRSGRHAEPAVYGQRRLRPLARRALMILRPLRVAIRARKPWVLARWSRLGWNVRFMARYPKFKTLRGAESYPCGAAKSILGRDRGGIRGVLGGQGLRSSTVCAGWRVVDPVICGRRRPMKMCRCQRSLPAARIRPPSGTMRPATRRETTVVGVSMSGGTSGLVARRLLAWSFPRSSVRACEYPVDSLLGSPAG